MKKPNSHITPIYRNSGFCFENLDQIGAAFDNLSQSAQGDYYIYSRYGNPTVVATEQHIAEMEGGKFSLLLPSGMAAVDVALSSLQKPSGNRWLFFSEIYGGTNDYIKNIVNDIRGIETMHLQPKDGRYDVEYVAQSLEELHPEVLFFEPLTNPMLIVCDGRAIIKAAKKLGIKVIVDNTFATPYLWKPLADGADIVLHSTTKYLSGHGDLAGGVITTNSEESFNSANKYRKFCGFQPSPDDAARLMSYLHSFDCRYNCHIDNAMRLAQFLQNHKSEVETVIYPGLENNPSYTTAKELFGGRGYGAMITFRLRGGRNAADRFAELLKGKINIVPTLGDAETIILPIAQVWKSKYPTEGYFRMSVGIENYESLEKIVGYALKNLQD